MAVLALGIQNRGVGAVIAPNGQDHLNCEECGMCIDLCPVGALTSGTYRYKTRPWEMNHVATICTHCGDGCKTTLGVRSVNDGVEIIRGDNRDKSGMNGDFLCNKGRYAFDFANRTTNEEAYLLQKFARTVLGTNNIDHHRTADYVSFAAALAGKAGCTASLRDTATAPAILLLGNNPTEQHPALAWNLRSNVRLHRARIYVANHEGIKLRRQAKAFVKIPQDGYASLVQYLTGNDGAIAGNDNTAAFRDAIRKEESLLIVFGSEYRGRDIQSLVEFGLGLPNSKFAALGDYVNSHGAADMGLLPDLLPGYVPVNNPAQFAEEYGSVLPQAEGLNLLQMFDAAERGNLAALYVVGSNPVSRYGVDPASLNNTFLVVQDMFMTETAALANVVFPAANLYEKAGTVTNTYGDIQLVKKAADKSGVRTDFELIVRLADRMGADPKKLVPFGRGVHADMGQSRGAQSGEADRHAVWLAANHLELKVSPFDPFATLDEIQRLVPSYNVSRLELLAGMDQQEKLDLVQIQPTASRRDLVLPAEDTLFTSGTLGRYSDMLKAIVESRTTPNPAETAAD